MLALIVGSLLTPSTALAQTSEASAQVRPAMGSVFHATWSDYDNAKRIRVLDMLAAAGVEWVRIDMGWDVFEKDGPGVYNQSYIDLVSHAVDAANARGIKVLGMIWWTPDWATGGRRGTYPPRDPADYGRFAGWIADQFKGRVQAWEIWNEPNHDSFWTGTIGEYVQLVKAAYPKIKAADPNALVVAGSTSHNDTTTLRKMYDAGMGGYFDVLSTHPYQGMQNDPPEVPDTTGDKWWLLSHVKSVRDLMKSRGDGSKKIWFTEYGWSAHKNTGGEENWELGVTPAQQADFLVRAAEFVKANYPYVTNMFWYNSRAKATGDVHQDGFGLLNRDFSPRLVYDALKSYTTANPPPSTDSEPTSESEPATEPDPDAPVVIRGQECTIVGTEGDDVLVGTPGDDVICGLGGDDEIRGGAGNDIIFGGRGNDVIFGGRGNDKLYGGRGNDVIRGNRGRDLLVGKAGRNRLHGGVGSDRCRANRTDRVRSCRRA